MKTYLYRHFDVYDRLLYVGITNNLQNRTKQHYKTSHWFYLSKRVTTEVFLTRAEALVAEAQVIMTEHPRHNLLRRSYQPSFLDKWNPWSKRAQASDDGDRAVDVDVAIRRAGAACGE